MVISEQTLVAKLHYPQDSIPVNNWAEGLAGAQAVATLAAAINRKTYLTKAIITTGAPATIQKLKVVITDGTWTQKFIVMETVTAGGFGNLDFGDAPLVSTATNTAITVTAPAVGSGDDVEVSLVGYQR